MALLPEVHQQQVKAEKFPEVTVDTNNEVELPGKSDLPEGQHSKSTSLLIPSNNSNTLPWMDHATATWKPSAFETPIKRGGSFENYHSEIGNYGSSILHGKLFSSSEVRQKPQVSGRKSFNFQDKSIPGIGHVNPVNSISTSLTKLNRRSSRVLPGSNLLGNPFESILPETEHNKIINQLQNTSSTHQLRAADLVTTPSSNRGLFKDSPQDIQQSISSKTFQQDTEDRPPNIISSEDLMDVSWR